MIPTELQTGLISRLENIFSNKGFNNPDSQKVPLQIFEQHLPVKASNDISYYPYVIVQLVDGEKPSALDSESAKVMFIIGCYDEDSKNQGYKEVTEVINKILIDLNKYPIQNNKFECKHPIKWAIHDEDVAPYFFGAIETTWSVPIFIRDDVEELI